MIKKKENFTVLTKGYFKIKNGDTFLLLDNNNNEVGKIDIDGDGMKVKLHNAEHDESDPEVVPRPKMQTWFDEHDYVLTKDSIRWIEYNPNPCGNEKATDCVIRSYCAAEDLEWDAAYKLACEAGKNLGCMPNDSQATNEVMVNEFGYTRHKISKELRGITVNEFACRYNKGIFVLVVPSHMVTVIDGEYYDTWDCGDKKVRAFYTKENMD